MATEIKCPSCGHQFALAEIEAEEFKRNLQQQMKEFMRKKDEEYKRREEELEQQKIQIESITARRVQEQFAARLKSLEEERNQKAQQIVEFEKKQLDLLRDKSELEQKEKNIEFEIEKRILETRPQIEEEVLKRGKELFDLKLKEKDTQMESLKKTIEELKRKSEQGSMQLQGEAQELLLEEILRDLFPFDTIESIGKGAEGADTVQVVRNSNMKECGRIIFESKRTKNWSNSWIDKLKSDMRSKNADIAVLVTQVFPRGTERFCERDGVWLCTFSEVAAVASILRDTLIKVAEVKKFEENKETKAQLVYSYLTSNEFKLQWNSIIEAYLSMKNNIEKERIQAEKQWKEREKQLYKIFKGATGFIGSIKGLGGMEIQELPSLENGELDTLPPL
jgi:hypothetical protein